MSIRLRLTLLYSAIVAMTVVAFGLAVYAITDRVTMDAAEQTLIAEARQMADRPVFVPGPVERPERPFPAPETMFIQVLYPDGSLAGKTTNLGNYQLPLSAAGLQACQNGQEWMEATSTESGRLLVYSRPVEIRGEYLGIVQVARSLADYDQSLGTLQRMLLIGGVAATCLAFVFGWLLAGTALRPIHHITETAAAIGAERDFGKRVEYRGPRDEVSQLARTFNAMLTELQSAYRQLEESLRVQRRFVADASHELRTPLTTIRGNLGLLQREPPIAPDDQVAVLGDMVGETERLMRLVSSLLMLARADAKQPLHSEPVPVAPLIDEACRQVRLLAPAREVTCTQEDGLAVLGDRDALKQLLLILLDNALKYTPDGAPIEVEAAAAGERVRVSVRDHGAGIPPDALPHIFERFYQADEARSNGGAGLGLAIARALAEGQGGTIAVASQVGQGSTFTIELPRTAA